jgi:LemA protein
MTGMDAASLSFLVFLGLVALVGVWFGVTYNKLVRLRNRIEATWAEIDVQLKRRHDLVPNLVHALEGYATHERGTLDEVTQARNQAMGALNTLARAKAEDMLSNALGRLFSDVEQYPQLQAEQDFKRLEQELTELERAIALSRQAYNLTVQAYNNTVQTLPTNVVASLGGFEERDYLVFEDGARQVPDVDVDVPPVPAAPSTPTS